MRCIEKVFQDFFCSMCWILFTLSDVTEFSPGAVGDDALVTEAMSEAQEAEQYLLFSSQSSPLH